MKILVINGSPKGEYSNTLRLTNAFLDGICNSYNGKKPTIERINISKLDINSCLGCFSCWRITPGQCCIHDDMKVVLEKMLWADLIIWSFPLYYFSLPGKLKTVIDRQLPLSLPFMETHVEGGGHPTRYDMSGKKTVLISTCGFYTADSNYDSVIAQFDRIYGKDNYTTLFCGEGELFSIPELSKRTDEYLKIVKQAGQEYASEGIKTETNVKLQELLFPRDVFERMADASRGISPIGEKEDKTLTFTKQMAALYNPAAYQGTDIILDMDYTDIGQKYRIILGKTKSCIVQEFNEKPTTIIHTPFTVWKSIASGEIEGSEALMNHLYWVEGDFDLMLKWNEYFGQGENKEKIEEKSEPNRKTDMSYTLIPWIIFWIAVNINTFWGSLLSIFVCCLLPLLFYENKKTVYDVISRTLVSILSILLITHFSIIIIVPLSYFIFGLIWSLSAYQKIPLTAEYSMNNYGGKSSFRNPIFIKTNRILTVAWGLLYLIISIWTYFIMRTGIGSYIGIINFILPIFMGIFTVWFQKWYPKKIACENHK